MGDNIGVFQAVPLSLQYYPNLLVTVVGNYDRKFKDILCSALVTIWENWSFGLDCTLTLRHLFLQPNQEAFRWCPRTLPLPTETLKHLAL